ncbi:hypothetical protein [Sandaracinus amylolyticus]|uniref:Serine/threonine-protein kinase transcriptional regulatory protein n=1 Tax=Sandaracinus amylolyticus TaxID=927083 RepID=A0A0F6W0C6_9BACT|nr:hypothetical protein [Sandaracinus amylolyticus]AKF04186.1 serine/threonine-protein kinase transcriptional regulatory protein [Sandaracinus amylolyticus]
MLGRRNERIAMQDALAAGARVVTLVGPGGAGKTTLAEAHLARSRAVVVELESRRDPLAAIAEALGLRSVAIGAGEVAAALDARGIVDVLVDRAEGVVDALAAVLPVLLEGAPDATWVVTSRVRLGIRDEHVIAIGGLDEDDAIALLRARAPGSHDEASLRAIARATEAMPLALELAAARLVDEDPMLVAQRIAAHRDAGAVGAAIEGALDALAPRLAVALRAFAALEGRFAHDAADALLDGPASIAALRDRALIQRAADGAPGWHRLHDEIRTRVRARTARDEAASNEARLASWLAREAPRWAHDLHEGEPAAALRALAAHERDLVLAFERCRDGAPEIAARIALGLEAWWLSRAPEARHAALVDAAIEAADRAGELALAIDLARVRARALFLRGRLPEARAACADAMQRARAGGDRRGALAVSNVASAIAREMGDPGAARALAERAIEESRALADAEAEVRAMHNLASALVVANDFVAGRALYLSTLAAARELRMRRIEALCLANLAIVHEVLGELDLSRARSAQGIAAFAAQGDRMMTAKLAMRAARVDIRTGALDEAERAIAGATADAEQLGDRGLLLEAHLARAERHAARGERARARAEADEALALARRLRAGATVPEIEALLAALGDDVREARRVELTIDEDASSFVLDGGARVDLARRASLRRILVHLAAEHARGGTASAAALIAIGWPGEKMSPESGAERVYTAIATLRRLGLASVLARRDGGYALDPAVVVVAPDAVR